MLYSYGDVFIAGERLQILTLLWVYGLWAGRDLYRAISALTLDLGFAVSSEGLSTLIALYDKQGVPLKKTQERPKSSYSFTEKEIFFR